MQVVRPGRRTPAPPGARELLTRPLIVVYTGSSVPATRTTRHREYQKHAVARGDRVPGPERRDGAMRLHVDKEADALYLRLDDSVIVESEEVSPGVVLDYNDSNEVVGVEMLHLSKRSVDLNLAALHFETT